MPTLPAFKQRLAQLNNPFYRAAESTPIEFGIPARSVIGPNPMQQKRPTGDGQRSIPLVQDASQIESSGTSSDQPMPMSASRTKQAIAGQVNYDDLRPQLEEIPNDPEFDQHSKHGFKDRLKAMFMGGAGAQAQQPNNQFAGIGGMIGGLINPGGAERLNYEEVVLPRARKKQQATVQRNDSRMKAFRTELDARMATAKINEANRPEYASMAGGEYSTLYNKANPDDQRLVMGPDGKPQRVASVLNTETRADSAEKLLQERNMAQAERDVEKAKAAFEMARQKAEYDRQIKEMQIKHQKELEAYRQSQLNNRFNKGEAGKNSRANQAEGGRNKRFAQRYGDDGAEAPKSELDKQIDSVAKKNAEKAAKRKTSAPPAN
jgi:hypothetical protein